MTAIALFVKTPGHSPVKTRLAAGLGRAQAEALYLQCARAVAEVGRQAALGPVYWAVAEEAAEVAAHWPDLPLLEQGSGGLGERMGRVHETLIQRHGRALLLGADAPQIRADALIQAAGWLDQPERRIAIGPARDGGFWLVGANRALPQADWQAVPYSDPQTLTRFRAVMATQGRWCTLATLTDLDEAGDLPAVAWELAALAAPTPGQRALLRTLAQWLPPPPPSA